jgi:hypothetical protein
MRMVARGGVVIVISGHPIVPDPLEPVRIVPDPLEPVRHLVYTHEAIVEFATSPGAEQWQGAKWRLFPISWSGERLFIGAVQISPQQPSWVPACANSDRDARAAHDD